MANMPVPALIDDPLSTGAEPPAHPSYPQPPTAAVAARPRTPAELSAAGLTWIHLDSPDALTAGNLAERFGWHPLDVEDVLSKRQRPKVDDYVDDGYLFVVLHFPVYDPTVGRLNAAELDVFVGPDYLVTLPTITLGPLTRLYQRCEENESFRDDLFAKGSGRLLYELLDDLFDYCFPILDKIGRKLDLLEDDVFEGRSDEVVRDLSSAKQEIISYRKIIKPERSTLRLLERHVERFLPEELDLYFDDIVDATERIWDMLDNYKEVVEALEGDERVGDLAPPERCPARAHRVLGDHPATDADHRRLRHEYPLPGLRHRVGVLGDLRPDGCCSRRHACVLPFEEVVVSSRV